MGKSGNFDCYDDYKQMLITDLPMVPNALLEQAIREATRRFCRDSKAWVETLPSVNLREGVVEYPLVVDYCANIILVKEVRLNTEANIDLGERGVTQNAAYYKFTQPETITLENVIKPAEDVTNGLEVDVALVPKMESWPWNKSDFAEWFLNIWYDAIVARTLYVLKSKKGRKYSDPSGAADAKADYNLYLNKARIQVKRKYKSKTRQLGG